MLLASLAHPQGVHSCIKHPLNLIILSDMWNCRTFIYVWLIESDMCTERIIQSGSNMTGTDFFFVTIIVHYSSNSQTGLNRF